MNNYPPKNSEMKVNTKVIDLNSYKNKPLIKNRLKDF